MTPDINVIKAARKVLGDAYRTNEDFRRTLINIVLRNLPESPEKETLAIQILDELFK